MKRLQTKNHVVYETIADGLHFFVLVDNEAMKTYLYCETEEPEIYYQEDRMWNDKDPVKQAEEYINKYIEIIKQGRKDYIEYCKNYNKDNGRIFGQPAITTREWLLS